MNDHKYQETSLSFKADAAFRQVAKKVIQRARQTATPVVIWEEGQIKELAEDQLKVSFTETQTRESRI